MNVLEFFTNAGYSVCSVSICLCMLFAYFLKNHQEKLELKSIYFILDLIAIIIMSILEQVYVIYYSSVGMDGPYSVLLYQLYSLAIVIITFFSWMFVIEYRVSMRPEEIKNSKRHYIYYVLIMIIQAVITVAIFASPVKIYKNYGIYTFKSLSISISLIYSLLSTSIFVFSLYFRNKTITKQDLYPSVVSLVIVILVLAYRIITGIDINIESYQFTIFVLGVFFTVENQDYKLLSMAKDKQRVAQSATKSQQDFLANMSHEIRSPMNTILGLSQLLLKEPDLTKPTVMDDMKNIHKEAVSLLSVVNNIADFSYVISTNNELDEKVYDLNGAVLALNKDIVSKITNDDVSFVCNVDEAMPKKLLGDSKKISKVLFSILNNIISHTTSGEIRLDVKSGKKDGEMLQIEFLIVSDNTVANKEIFDVNSDNLIADAEGDKLNSSSIGLLIAKNLTKSLNGKLEFAQEGEKGIKYRFTITQKVIDATPIGSEIKNEIVSAVNKFDLSGKKVLIVDTNVVDAKGVKRLLDDYNLSTDICSSGSEAIEIVKNNRYDLIMIEYMMPTLDGVQTLIGIKKEVSYTPLTIVLAASSYSAEKDKYVKDGFNEYLAKPVNAEELDIVLHKMFYESQGSVSTTNQASVDEGGLI